MNIQYTLYIYTIQPQCPIVFSGKKLKGNTIYKQECVGETEERWG